MIIEQGNSVYSGQQSMFGLDGFGAWSWSAVAAGGTAEICARLWVGPMLEATVDTMPMIAVRTDVSPMIDATVGDGCC